MTVKEFIQNNPESILNLMTPGGYVLIGPEQGKRLLEGQAIEAHAGTSEAKMSIPSHEILSQELIQIHSHNKIPHYYCGISDIPMDRHCQTKSFSKGIQLTM